MVIPAVHTRFDVIANLVYQVDFKERLSTDKVPNHGGFRKFIFAVQNVVYRLLGHVKCHPLLCVFAYQITILTCQLAIFRDNKCYGFRLAILPRFGIVLYFHIFSYQRVGKQVVVVLHEPEQLLLHVIEQTEQLPAQLPLQLPWQSFPQLPLQVPVQLLHVPIHVPEHPSQ